MSVFASFLIFFLHFPVLFCFFFLSLLFLSNYSEMFPGEERKGSIHTPLSNEPLTNEGVAELALFLSVDFFWGVDGWASQAEGNVREGREFRTPTTKSSINQTKSIIESNAIAHQIKANQRLLPLPLLPLLALGERQACKTLHSSHSLFLFHCLSAASAYQGRYPM